MKNKALITTAIIFFLIIMDRSYINEIIGTFEYLSLLVIYIVFLIVFILQFYFLVKEKLKNKFRFFNIGLLIIILPFFFPFPTGFVSVKELKSENALIAVKNGDELDGLSIGLKKDLTFIQKDRYFGMKWKKGTYQVSNDTIYFLKGKKILGYEFAVIKALEFYTEHPNELILFKDKNDTIGYPYLTCGDINDLKPNNQINIKK